MAREHVEAKARRYLTEGRLHVRRVDDDGSVIEASCRGSGAVYELGFDEQGWFCGCPARGVCSHLAALQLVAVASGPTR